MSQTQTQTPEKDFFVTLSYDTWGSFGQYSKDIAVLIDGSVVDPSKTKCFFKSGEYKKKITIGGKEYELVVECNDSRKNAHRKVYVPKEIVLAVINDYKSSSGWKGFSLSGEGEIEVNEEEKTWENGRYRYHKVVQVYYYVNKEKNIKVPLKEIEIDFRKELIGKPMVKISARFDEQKQEYSDIEITGDTYQVKEVLKSYGFKFNWLERTWERSSISKKELDELISVLKEKHGYEVEIQ